MNRSRRSHKSYHYSAASLLLAGCVTVCGSVPSRAAATWTEIYGGSTHGADYAETVANDGSGGVVVTGQSDTTGHHIGISTIDYNSAGSVVWSHSETVPYTSANIEGSHIAVDSSGNTTVTAMPDNNPNNILFVAEYTPSGTRTARLEVTLPNSSAQIDRLQSYANGDFTVEGTDVVTDSSTGAQTTYWLVARYDDNGNLLWADNYTDVSPGDYNLFNEAKSGRVDSQGDLVVVGTVTVDAQSGATCLADRKYDPSGNVLDTTIVPETNGHNATAAFLAMDGSDNAYIAGHSAYMSGDAQSSQIEAVKVSTDGTVDWQEYFGNSGDYDTSDTVAVDKGGNVIAGGTVSYPGNGSSQSYSETMLVKWDDNGNLVWSHGQHKVDNSQNNIHYVFAVNGTDELWTVAQITDLGSVTVNKLAVDKYASDGTLESDSVYDGSSTNPNTVTVGGAAYYPSADSLFAIGWQNDSPASDSSAPNYDWFTQKY